MENSATAPVTGEFSASFECSASLRIDTVWKPFVEEQRVYLETLLSENVRSTVIVLNFGLWDLLHNHDAVRFEEEVKEYFITLRKLIDSYQPRERAPIVIILQNGILEPEKMSTEEKKLYMTPKDSHMYSIIMKKYISSLGLTESVEQVDLYSLMENVTDERTIDGVHPTTKIEDALVQILINKINNKVIPEGNGAKQNRTELKSRGILANTPAPASFVGRYPILGLFVGIYIFAVLASGDVFLVTHLLMKLVDS